MDKKFNKAMKAQKQQLEQENRICDATYDAIQEFINQGMFLDVESPYSTVMIEDPDTKRLSIIVELDGVEYEMTVHKVSHN